jgi:hypothetical protein
MALRFFVTDLDLTVAYRRPRRGSPLRFGDRQFLRCPFVGRGDHDDNIDVNTTDEFILSQPSFERLPTTADFSPSRRHSILILEPQSRTLMLFGGIHDPSRLLSDTWVYGLGSSCP